VLTKAMLPPPITLSTSSWNVNGGLVMYAHRFEQCALHTSRGAERERQMEPPYSYGATVPLSEHHPHGGGPEELLYRQHKRISRVVTGIAGACATVFIIAVCANPPIYHSHATGMQQLADIQGFGCNQFCKHFPVLHSIMPVLGFL
jgi:hypothetical protein